MTTLQKWLALDHLGTVLCLGMVTSLLLPLQWGGNTRPWSDKTVIAMLCVFGVLLIMFIAWEFHRKDTAILPLRLFWNRTLTGTAIESFFLLLSVLVGTYYLPLWYQSKGHSATRSGIDILPFMLSSVVAAASAGGFISYTGRYWPFLFFSPMIAAVGAGLLFTAGADTANAKVIGFQILFGVGIGAALQNTIIAVQAEYANDQKMLNQASSLVAFIQLVGGIMGIAIAGTVFSNQLRSKLALYAPSLSSDLVEAVRQSVTAVKTLPADQQAEVIKAYAAALDAVFMIGVPACILGSIACFLIRPWNLKERSVKLGMV